MNSWIILLRGINVGGKNVVSMNELKALLADAGFSNVRSYIQSGNVVLDTAARPTDEISCLIEREFGFRPTIFVMSRADFEKAIKNNPYGPDGGKTVHFFFCSKVPTTVDYDFLESIKDDSEDYTLIGNVLYFYAPKGVGRSAFVQRMAKAFPGIEMTARNVNTINKLAQMLGPPRG